MIACHQVRPRGISALPVRYVAILQLISSPADFSAYIHMRGDVLLYKNCYKLKMPRCAARSRLAGHHRSWRAVRIITHAEGLHAIPTSATPPATQFVCARSKISFRNDFDQTNRENGGFCQLKWPDASEGPTGVDVFKDVFF